MKLTIKRIELRDIGPAMQLLRQLFAETDSQVQYPTIDEEEFEALGILLLSTAANPLTLYLIAYDGKKPTGVFIGEVGLRAYGKPRVFGIARDLYVVPEKRGQGVATRLLAVALAYAKSNGINQLEVVARPGKAQQRWEKLGFRPYLINSNMATAEIPFGRHDTQQVSQEKQLGY